MHTRVVCAHKEWCVCIQGLCVCIRSGMYAHRGCVCAYGVMCVYASSGQKFPDVLVALLLLEWTLDDPLCCCCGDC